MLSTENKIVPGSDYYIYTPSAQARKLFLYPLIVGYFRYLPGYSIRRASLDSFLIMYIKKGECDIEFADKSFHARDGQIVLLDCYAPHRYGSRTGWEAEWIHFDGTCARGYYEAICEAAGPVITLRDTYRFEKYLHKIYLLFRDHLSVKEALINNYIVNLMTELLIGLDSEHSVSLTSGIIEDTIAYISDHLTDELSLELLSAQASLSPFYFSRLFKRETGFSPHSYIISARINHAKYLLRFSSLPIKDICFSTGFSSESSFCTCFKKVTGVKPSDYREACKN